MTEPQQECADPVADPVDFDDEATPDPLPGLINTEDPDWRRFQDDDPEYFLRVAGRAIRVFCGWHIFPSRTVTVHKLSIGTRGVIMLPSRYVTDVQQVTVYGGSAHAHTLLPDDYLWHQAGWIERKGQTYYNDGWWEQGAYVYGNDPYYLPVTEPGHAAVTFTHGYDELPEDVKQVAFELAEQAMTIHSGNVKMLEAPIGFRVQASQNFGLSFNPEQIARLANYRIGFTS